MNEQIVGQSSWLQEPTQADTAEQGFIRRIWGSSQNQHKDQRIKLCKWTATKGSQAGGTMAKAVSQEYPAKDTSAGTTAARADVPGMATTGH